MAGEDPSAEGGRPDRPRRRLGEGRVLVVGGEGLARQVVGDIQGEDKDQVLVSRRWAAHPRAANVSASEMPLAKGLSALVWAGAQEVKMELLRFTA